MTPERTKHLEFIQNVITRMNANSFQIKGMSVTITAALLALYASANKVLYLFAALVPTVIFWFLDAYYLQQERRYRRLYNDAAGLTSYRTVSDFDMAAQAYRDENCRYQNVLCSRTILPVYLFQIMLLVIGGVVFSFLQH